MARLPVKIEKCPITEAVLEIRYTSEYPMDAIFGVVYAAIKDVFTDAPISLPILQIPELVREQDPNLKYQPYHQLEKDGMILKIGPRVLTFIHPAPYRGWTVWSDFFYGVLGKIKTANVLSKAERIGLRYINIFDDNIFDKVKVEVKIDDKILDQESTSLRTEIVDDEMVKVLQIGNLVSVKKEEGVVERSAIDIDCLCEMDETLAFFDQYREVIENAHVKEKEQFFALLKESFLKELKPDYGE